MTKNWKKNWSWKKCIFFYQKIAIYLSLGLYKGENAFSPQKRTSSKCCGSGMFIPDPGSWFLPIPDPRFRNPDPKQQQKRGVKKKLVVISFFVACNFTKLNIILFLKCWRKKFGPIFKELWKFSSFQKYGFGIRKKLIPDPGYRGQKGTGSRIRIRNTASSSSKHKIS